MTSGRGGQQESVCLSDLPEPVRLAYQVRQAERAGLAAGVQDEAAHLALMAKPMGTQKRAHDRAAILVFVVKHRQAGLNWPNTLARLASAGFNEAPSKVTLKRWLKEVENVDPINWAPALAPDYSTRGAPLAKCHPDAWADYEARIAASGRNGTGANFKQLHGKTKAKAEENGWAFPPYRTVMRHWKKLAVERQRTLKDGAEAAAQSLTHYLPRSLEGMAAMEQVEVDFREFKVQCIWEDGEIGCPWVGIAGDRASSKIVGWTVQKSKKAEGYFALTRNMIEAHGIPDRVVQDNGAGGNSHRMMGGYTPLVRRKDKGERSAEWAVPGVYKFLGIEVVNHGPRMAWAKFVESLNSIMRHVDNDPAFYLAQRSGPIDAPNPDAVPVPIALFRAVLQRAIADLNADTESRAQGLLKGECRNAGFQRLSAGRTTRWPSPLQLRWMRLSWHRHKVTNSGQVKYGQRFWGDGTTQRAMLHYAGQSVVIGIEPGNPTAPAMVYEWNDTARTGRLLLEKLPAVIEARHADPASKVRAQAEKRRAKAAAQAEVIPDLDEWVAAERAKILQEMGLPVPARPAPKVTKLTTGGPFSPAEARHQPAQMNARTKTDLYFAMKAEEERTASGGTR
jgi:putative transposase